MQAITDCAVHRLRTLDLSLLKDETINFCDDLLMHCRDQRLKEKRGADAEIQPINMPELLRALEVVTSMWRDILEPHSSAKVLATFDRIQGAFCDADRIRNLLLRQEHFSTMCIVEQSLRSVLEHY